MKIKLQLFQREKSSISVIIVNVIIMVKIIADVNTRNTLLNNGI